MGGLNGGFEALEIGSCIEHDRRLVGLKGFAKVLAERGERRSQAHPSGFNLAVRPEAVDQLLAWPRPAGAVGQEREQRRGLLRAKPGDGR